MDKKVAIITGGSSLAARLIEALGDDYEVEEGPIVITKQEDFPDYILASDHINDSLPHNKKGGRRKW